MHSSILVMSLILVLGHLVINTPIKTHYANIIQVFIEPRWRRLVFNSSTSSTFIFSAPLLHNSRVKTVTLPISIRERWTKRSGSSFSSAPGGCPSLLFVKMTNVVDRDLMTGPEIKLLSAAGVCDRLWRKSSHNRDKAMPLLS